MRLFSSIRFLFISLPFLSLTQDRATKTTLIESERSTSWLKEISSERNEIRLPGKSWKSWNSKKKLHDYLLHESNRINRDPNRSHVANSFFLSSEQTNKIQSSDDNYEFYKFHSIPQRSFHPVVFQRILQRDEEIQGDNKEGRWCAEDKIKFRESTKRGRGANRISRGEVLACTPRMIHQAWKSPRPSMSAAGSGGGGGSLHSSSTSPPPASRRSSIRGAPPLPRTFQWRHWSLGTPSDKIRPPRSGISCYCVASIPMEMLLVLPRWIPKD